MPVIHHRWTQLGILTLVFVLVAVQANAQDPQAELSPFLSRTYFNFNFGPLDSPFTNAHLNEGYVAETIRTPPVSGRLLLGYELTPKWAFQFGVMRPIEWTYYQNVNGEQNKSSVWVNIWSWSLKRDFRVTNQLSLYAEAGVANIARHGFSIRGNVVNEDARYFGWVFGSGLQYQLGPRWDAMLNLVHLPESTKENQPSTTQLSLGATVHFNQSAAAVADRDSQPTFVFPLNVIQIGYTHHGVGFGVNDFFSLNGNIGVPIFWRGDAEIAQAFAVMYQRNAFHTAKRFSLDWGVSLYGLKTAINDTNLFAISVFPVLKYWVWRSGPVDVYLHYSILGPAYISQANIENVKTGPRVTFQDFLGAGLLFGQERHYNLDFKVTHYSNGNMFPDNEGVAVPLMLSVGRTF